MHLLSTSEMDRNHQTYQLTFKVFVCRDDGRVGPWTNAGRNKAAWKMMPRVKEKEAEGSKRQGREEMEEAVSFNRRQGREQIGFKGASKRCHNTLTQKSPLVTLSYQKIETWISKRNLSKMVRSRRYDHSYEYAFKWLAKQLRKF